MAKSIPKLDQEIISKLENGMSPAQISIEYEQNGMEVSASHCRMIKMLLEANLIDTLKQPAGGENRWYRNSREYSAAKMGQ